uniref:Uncharacterized protein n=1 Tax=Anguilla anguilla TaxID=7936 RepID=A0A0E9TMV6_ANGAN
MLGAPLLQALQSINTISIQFSVTMSYLCWSNTQNVGPQTQDCTYSSQKIIIFICFPYTHMPQHNFGSLI